jgi:hypothetical protein
MSSGSTYRPVDLSAWRNSGVEVLGAPRTTPVGEQVFHGLPFQIGDGNRAFALFGAGGHAESQRIAIGSTAHAVIVAHRLLGGGLVGQEVATYTFRLADGSEHPIPIRGRFEIGDITDWGQLPFLARPDQKNELLDRWAGAWSEAGRRQTESDQGSPLAYYLWYWVNPRLDVPVESLTIDPRGPRFVVAAVTLGLTVEEPFTRDGAVPVRIELKDAQLGVRRLEPGPTSMEVDVDRGVAGYVYQLPSGSAEQFLRDPFAGWGEQQNTASNPVYAEITAIPSATVAIRIGEQQVDAVRWATFAMARSTPTTCA